MFNVNEGWGPLCKFLDKEVPNVAFPRKNIDGKDLNPEFEAHLVGKQIAKEVNFSAIILLVLTGIALYYFMF